MKTCTNCGGQNLPGQWWSLRNYYGISGYFCPDCYDRVSHNAYGQPERPAEFLMVLLKNNG